ncbi:MAG: hypothetical protein PHE50_02830 [Dehalococcoidales bacterium]|nr:hypothetical protein [Dehalococcoidales bacterium]
MIVLTDNPDFDNTNPVWDGKPIPSIEGSSTTIIARFNEHGRPIVPFWNTVAAYHAAFNPKHGGENTSKLVVILDRDLFIKMLDPQETCVLNVGLGSKMTFTGAELALIFLDPSVSVK